MLSVSNWFLLWWFVLASGESSTIKLPCICRYGTCTTPKLHGTSFYVPWFTFVNNSNCWSLSRPNFLQEKHEANHQPKLHGGLVIKTNANQRYATNVVTSFIFREIASKHKLPVQVSSVNNFISLFFLCDWNWNWLLRQRESLLYFSICSILNYQKLGIV